MNIINEDISSIENIENVSTIETHLINIDKNLNSCVYILSSLTFVFVAYFLYYVLRRLFFERR